MAAHRYWRISLKATVGGAYAFSEVQFRTTAGVSLPFSGGNATAADTFGSVPGANDANKAADANIATLYSANSTTLPQWWAYDLGAGNTRDVVEVAITARNDSNYNQAPSTYVPEWSDDGTAWFSMAYVTTTAWASAGQVKLGAVSVLSLNTSWSPSDQSSPGGLPLSNNNLTVQGFSVTSLRASNPQATGKYYWEATSPNWGGTITRIGLANSSAALGVNNTTNALTVMASGGVINLNNAGTGLSLGDRANGDIIGIAVDLGAGLAWFRVAPAGNWNGTAGAAPGGTGGINFSAIAGSGLYPYAYFAASHSFTANFGDAAFSGAVPSGYTSGWPVAAAAAAPSGQTVRAMVLA